MARRTAPDESESSGYDSFLDVVANLVGILLILIMVVGYRTRDAWKRASADPSLLATWTPTGLEASTDHLRDQLTQAERELASLKQNAFELDRKATETAVLTDGKKQERDHLQLLVSAAEKALAAASQTLDGDQQAKYDRAKDVEAARATLEKRRQEIDAARSAAGSPTVLDHRPTPLAKTVFGQEEHFRLLDGRLVYVPLNELIDELKRDAGNKIWKLKHVDEITETLPPRGGFRLKYTMQRRQRREMTDTGPILRSTVELDRFVLLPVDDQPGLPVTEALQEGSAFRQKLSNFDPAQVTITVWTYPDSYPQFRELKDFLGQQGYLVAGRPLPAGFPIGGSPDGNRSSAE